MAGTKFIKKCGKYRTGYDAAEKAAREINGYHLSKDYEHLACNREATIELLNDERVVIMGDYNERRD